MNRHLITAFLGAGLFTGILIAWQFNTEIPVPTNFPSDQIEAKEALLKSFLNEQSYLQSRIVSLRERVTEAQELVDEHGDAASVALLEELKSNVGLSEALGPGLQIILDDSPAALRSVAEVSDAQLIQAADIRDMINVLSAANAEAISVNGQRIIATSPVSSVGTSLLINNAHVAPPFVISAVGDEKLMMQRMIENNLVKSLSERALKDGVVFQVTSKERLKIPIYNGDLKVSYLNLVE